jgi:hypothetical protein
LFRFEVTHLVCGLQGHGMLLEMLPYGARRAQGVIETKLVMNFVAGRLSQKESLVRLANKRWEVCTVAYAHRMPAAAPWFRLAVAAGSPQHLSGPAKPQRKGSNGTMMRQPDHNLDKCSLDTESGSPQALPLDEAAGTKASRRDLLRGTLASVAALVFARQTTLQADAQAAGGGTQVLLPVQVAADYLRQRLLPDPIFQKYYLPFTQQGFQFIPERVQLAMGVRPSQPGVALSPSLPYLLAVVPSFRPVDRNAASHEAVSIVVLRERRVNTVLASSVTVSHRPFQIASFTILELDRTGKLVSHSINRSQLATLSPDQLARVLGAPDLKAAAAEGEVPVPTESDALSLASVAYRNLLLDTFARPLYPPAGLQSMLAETSLVQKWALVNRKRYQDGASALGISLCTSCSTSCNACCSSSSSTISFSL